MDHAFVEAIDIHGDRLKASALRAGPTPMVPHCPEWTMRDLVAHVATVLSWATTKIADPSREPGTAPSDWEDLLGWWDGQRLALREMLLRRPPDTPSWFPFRPGSTLETWARRMAHETAIHRLDAESALGVADGTAFKPSFAEDGVDEFLGTLVSTRLTWATAPATIGVRTIDTERSWTLRCTPDATPERVTDGTPDVTLSGSANDVYRALWGRPNAVEVSGHGELLVFLRLP